MPFPSANFAVSVRGRRGNATVWARNIEVHIFPTEMLPVLDQALPAARFRYGMHWDPDDTLDDGTEEGSPIREGDILLWDQYPNQEMALSHVLVAKGGIDDDFRLLTAYFYPVAEGEGGS